MINKDKLQQTTDLFDFMETEKQMLLSGIEYEQLKADYRTAIKECRKEQAYEEMAFYLELRNNVKKRVNDEMLWLDSKERYAMLEGKAQSDFVKSIFRMKRGDN